MAFLGHLKKIKCSRHVKCPTAETSKWGFKRFSWVRKDCTKWNPPTKGLSCTSWQTTSHLPKNQSFHSKALWGHGKREPSAVGSALLGFGTSLDSESHDGYQCATGTATRHVRRRQGARRLTDSSDSTGSCLDASSFATHQHPLQAWCVNMSGIHFHCNIEFKMESVSWWRFITCGLSTSGNQHRIWT